MEVLSVMLSYAQAIVVLIGACLLCGLISFILWDCCDD